jgi:hypothetical protein
MNPKGLMLIFIRKQKVLFLKTKSIYFHMLWKIKKEIH